ncbi:MAG: membrane protein insertion efficiency factor YidD [Candidatus Aminicenantia bacterium]
MIKKFFLKTIRFYKLFISPFLGSKCRFYPTCSDYAHQAIEKHGVFKGIFLGLMRIIRCNPLHPGGIDEVP